MNNFLHKRKKNYTARKPATRNFKLESHHLMIFGLFFGMGSILFLSGKLLLPKIFILQIVVVCCLAGLLIPMKIYDKYLGWGRIESFMLNIFGVGPLFCAALMWSNHLIVIDERTATYNIENVQLITDLDAYFLFQLENNAMFDFPEFREVILRNGNYQYKDATAISYKITTGILGYDVVKETKVIL